MKPLRRRLAAVLHADVVGYSRLMEQAETRTLRELQRARREIWDPTVHRHGGRLVGTAGDAVLIEFASAVSAVACAVDLQRATMARAAALPEPQRMRLRIGINLGDVVVEDDGDLFGEGVNLAQRLEALADADGILVSQNVRDQVERKLRGVSLVDAGQHRMKNIARPVHAWRVEFAAEAPVAAATVREEAGWVLAARSSRSKVEDQLLDAGVLASAEGVVIGRHSRYSAIVLAFDGVSRRHARLRSNGGKLTIEDLGSTNGTFLGERRIAAFAPTELRSGARLRIGGLDFVLQRRRSVP